MIIVTGSLLARADAVERLLELSLAHVQRSRQEPGCISHAVFRDVEEPLRLVFLEEWENRESLIAHFADPRSRGFVKAASALAATPPMLKVFEAGPMTL